MKLETFHTLQAVLATGSMAKAAQQLHLTPGAVSMQMKQLEAFMGVVLFDRSSHSVRVRPLAQEVNSAAAAFLAQIDAMRQRSSLVVQGTVRLGMLDSLQPRLLPLALAYLAAHYPQLSVQVLRGKSKQLQQLVRAGEVDVAVLAQPAQDALSRGLHWQPLMRTPFVLVAPPDAQGDVAHCLQRYRVIAYDRSTTSGGLAAAYLRDVHGLGQTEMEFDNVSAIVSMVGLGLGVAVLQIADPRILKMDAVQVMPLGAMGPTMQYAVLTRHDDAENRKIKAMCEALLQLPGCAPESA